MTGCMLISLNVVSIAAVDCDSTSRWATRWRRRDIATRCSGRSPSTRSMFTGDGSGIEGFAAGAGACNKFVTSSLVTRPPRPLPLICEGSRLLSAAIFFADGMTAGDSVLVAAASAVLVLGGLAAATAEAAPAGAFASVSMVAITSLLATVPPSPLMTLLNSPDAGAGSSSTTLSVSMSIRFSSRLTNSPCFLCHDSNVASATDSDSAGTFTSTNMARSLLVQRTRTCAFFRRRDCLNAANPLNAVRQGGVHYRLLPLVVQYKISARGRGGRRSQRVRQLLMGQHLALQVMLNPVPRTLVAGFFLAPDDFLRILVAIDLDLELVVREGIKLFQPHDCNIVDAALAARGHEIEINLAAAKHDTLHFLRILQFGIRDHHLIFTAGQILQRRHRLLVTQQALRTDDDQWLAKRPDHLPAQQMEHLRRGGWNPDLHVVVRTQLQITFDPCRGMLRALALITVRQHQCEPADSSPLDFAGGNELVDYNLRAVTEVTELRFPDDQFVRLRRRIAVLETEHRLFGKHRIDHHQVRLVLADVLQWNVGARIPAFAILLLPPAVPMEERTPPPSL